MHPVLTPNKMQGYFDRPLRQAQGPVETTLVVKMTFVRRWVKVFVWLWRALAVMGYAFDRNR
jgi:hypothetical protein